MFSVEISGLSVAYRKTTALDDVSLTIEAGSICGLLGRNGSGKTTLLSTIAAFRRADSGRLRGRSSPVAIAVLAVWTYAVFRVADGVSVRPKIA